MNFRLWIESDISNWHPEVIKQLDANPLNKGWRQNQSLIDYVQKNLNSMTATAIERSKIPPQPQEPEPEEDEREIPKIRGEYWINDGYVEYADGDVGDYNHEAIASLSVIRNYTDKLEELAHKLKIKGEKDYWGREKYFDEEHPDTSDIINKIESALERKGIRDTDKYIKKQIGTDDEAFNILRGGEAKDYVIIHMGFIAVRGQEIELYDYQKQRDDLKSGLHDIIEQEGNHEEFNPEGMDFSIYEHKTGKRIDATLADIENVQPTPKIQPNFVPQTQAMDRRFVHVPADTAENLPHKTPSAIKNTGWRGTSEGVM